MDMKLNAAVIRLERDKRAWSQEHLAGVSGLALRTIQRIESTGMASYESTSAIAAVFGLPVTALRDDGVDPATRTRGTYGWLTWHRLLTLLGCGIAAAILTPPNYRVTILVAVALWVGCEFAIQTRRRDRPMNPS
jgi:transcriptional regulator with XRE-family HTH domain